MEMHDCAFIPRYGIHVCVSKRRYSSIEICELGKIESTVAERQESGRACRRPGVSDWVDRRPPSQRTVQVSEKEHCEQSK